MIVNPMVPIVERYVIRGRCAADPCASLNGVKSRGMALVLTPTVVGVVAAHYTPFGAGAILVASVFWFAVATLGLAEATERAEYCNQVDQHHGEGSS